MEGAEVDEPAPDITGSVDIGRLGKSGKIAAILTRF
jgi:hypothetical protein